MDTINELIRNTVSRRTFLSGAGVAAATSLAAGCGGGNSNSNPNPNPTPTPTTTTTTYTDVDYLNFALNLEYLEAEFYLRAVTGNGLATADIGAKPGAVTGGAQVTFSTPALQQYATEIAADEQYHVQFLRSAITSLGGTPVDRPAIDLTAFAAAATAATISGTFNPFNDENDFVLGAFLFEDVGVTAYNGAGPLITNKATVLAAAGSIVAVEAYHGGLIRTLLIALGGQYVTNANLISTLRGKASAAASGSNSDEVQLSSTTIAPSNSNGMAYARTTDEVLHIVYLGATAGVVSKGGFFPNGMNGNITASVS